MEEHRGQIRLLLLVASLAGMLALSSGLAWAQEEESSSQPSSQTSMSGTHGATAGGQRDESITRGNSSEDKKDEGLTRGGAQARYVPLLNTDRLIKLGNTRRFLLLYGTSLSEAYDDRIGDTQPRTTGTLTSWGPYVGILGHTSRTQYVFQYSPTVTYLSKLNLGAQAFHNGSFFITKEASRSWGWDFSLSSQYGEDALRLLSPSGYTAVAGVAVLNPDSFVFAPSLENFFANEASLGVRWRVNERRQVRFTLNHFYRDSLSTRPHTNSGGFSMEFAQSLSHRTNILAYGEVHRVSEFRLSCNSYGGGLGLAIDVSRRTSFEVRAGPEIGSPGCSTQQGVGSHGTFVVRSIENSYFYMAYDRYFNTPFVYTNHSGSRDSAVGGFDKTTRRGMEFRLDTGYYRVGLCCGSRPFLGYFVSPQMGWQISHSVRALVSYRTYYRRANPSYLGRNQVFLTLEWKPTPVGLTK